MTNEEKIIQGAEDFAKRFEPVMRDLMYEEKIKEIINKKENSYSSWCYSMLEDAMQEYGEWVRQQTLEEAIASLPEEAQTDRCDLFTKENNCVICATKESRNMFRQQTLSNLQALKDKNK